MHGAVFYGCICSLFRKFDLDLRINQRSRLRITHEYNVVLTIIYICGNKTISVCNTTTTQLIEIVFFLDKLIASTAEYF